MKPVNPALLIDSPIKVQFNDKPYTGDEAGPAMVQQSNNGYGGHLITVYQKVVEELCKGSNIPKTHLTLGLLYHEIAHIKYDSFQHRRSNSNQLYSWVENVIEDIRIEYQIGFSYPYVSRFIALTSLAAKDKIITDALDADSEISKLTGQLLQITKLNHVPKGCSTEFLEFMVPRVMLARRSNRQKASAIIWEIYNYLALFVDDQDRVSLEDFKPQAGQSGEAEGEEASEGESQGEAESESSPEGNSSGKEQTGEKEDEEEKEAKEGSDKPDKEEDPYAEAKQEKMDKLVEQLEKDFGSNSSASFGSGGSGAGGGIEEVISDLVGEDDFVRTTLNSNSTLIQKVNKAFAEIFTARKMVPVKEGDLNLSRQQDAYLRSKDGEEGYDYSVLRKEDTAFDCVVLRDTSGSTQFVKKEYAIATAIITKALEEMVNVNVAIVDFDSTIKERKTFQQPLSKSNIRPIATGGTELANALRHLLKMQFKHKLKLVLIVTDGCPNSFTEVEEVLKSKEAKEFIFLPIVFDTTGSGSYATPYMKSTFGVTEEIADLEDLHKAVHKLIKAKVVGRI